MCGEAWLLTSETAVEERRLTTSGMCQHDVLVSEESQLPPWECVKWRAITRTEFGVDGAIGELNCRVGVSLVVPRGVRAPRPYGVLPLPLPLTLTLTPSLTLPLPPSPPTLGVLVFDAESGSASDANAADGTGGSESDADDEDGMAVYVAAEVTVNSQP